MNDETNYADLLKLSVAKVIEAAQSMDDASLIALHAQELAGENRSSLLKWINGEQQERASRPGNRVDGEEYLAVELEKLGYARDGGPIDASYAQKAIFALTGVTADRDGLRNELMATGDALRLSKEMDGNARTTILELQTQLDAVTAENDLLKAGPVITGDDRIQTLFGGNPTDFVAVDELRNDDFDGFIPLNGAAVVLFDADGKRIETIDAQRFGSSKFRRSGRSVTLDADIEFAPTLSEVEVAGAVLVEFEADDVSDGFARSTLVQPFAVGGGRNAKLPAGTLTFR